MKSRAFTTIASKGLDAGNSEDNYSSNSDSGSTRMHGISARVCRAAVVAGACLAITTAGVDAARAEPNLAFDIEITLSTKAAQKLKTTGEGISLDAFYYGKSNAAGRKHANEMGIVDLANETVDVPGQAGRVHISGHDVSARRLAWVVKPSVNVNVYSSRKASDDNILSCDFIDGGVEEVIGISPVELHCSLLSEHLDTNVLP